MPDSLAHARRPNELFKYIAQFAPGGSLNMMAARIAVKLLTLYHTFDVLYGIPNIY